MSCDSERLAQEERGIIARLFKTSGTGQVTDSNDQRDIHRLGTVRKLLAMLRND